MNEDVAPELRRTKRATVVLVGVAVVAVGLVTVLTFVVVNTGHDSGDRTNESVRGQLGLGATALGQRAPAFTLPRLSGDGSLRLADYRGKVLVVNFWRSDCTPCRDEFPLLRGGADGAQVIGISTDAIRSDARRFVAREHARWPQALDEHLAVAEAFGLRSSLPQTFFVRRDGTIAYHVFGQLDAKLLRAGIAAADHRDPPS